MLTHTRLAPAALAAALVAALAGATAAAAQGNLSTQGFGYPPGQLSTRAQGTAGALGEFDPVSPLNPAALSEWGRNALYAQYAPERRRVSVTGASDRAIVPRFPVIGGALRVGETGVIGVTASTLLDRSWETDQKVTRDIFGQQFTATEAQRSTGAINDVRLAGSWSVGRALSLGLGLHAFTGQNRVRRQLLFEDTTFTDFTETTTLDYSGKGVSAGLVLRLASFSLGASGAVGGKLRAYRGDTTVASATVPPRVGVGLRFTGIAGTTLAARADWRGWSRADKLGSETVIARDGWDTSLGAEVKGPRAFGGDLPLRVGVRWRTLPFAVSAGDVKEFGVAGGFGLPMASGRVSADVTVEHARRSAPGNLRENALTLSVGLMVRL